MTCLICKTGKLEPGTATVTLERGASIVIIREVPADVCDTCGEYYLDSATASAVYRQAEDAISRRVDVEILRYAA